MDNEQMNNNDTNSSENDLLLNVEPPRLIGVKFDDSPIDFDTVLEVKSDVDQVFSFVLYCNHMHLIQDIIINNRSDRDIDGLRLEIKTDNELIDPFYKKINLPANKQIDIRRPELIVHGSYIATLTEVMDCILSISIYKDTEEVYKESHKISILPFDVWPGLSFEANLLAAFVIPNHPVIENIKHDAAAYLKKFTDSSAFDGYQQEDPNRVLNMIASMYYALQKKDIIYSEPPSSSTGQKVRLPDEIINTRLGTCLDLTLLYAACLEQCGLRTLLIMLKDHIFLGVWLVKDAEASEYLAQDHSQLDKRIADGVNEIVVIECTAICSGQNVSFDVARADAEKTLSDRQDDFELFVDVNRARLSGVKPLPVRRFEDGKYIVDDKDIENITNAEAPTLVSEAVSIEDDYSSKAKITKLDQWERKLLDFSMRNLLINVRPKSAMVPLLIDDLYRFEDSISSENDYEIVPRPLEWNAHGINAFDFESLSNLGPYSKVIEDSIKHNKVNSWLPEKELKKVITKLYRTAKSSMEENGANTLYLALGVLKFFEDKAKSKAHYAPIVLVPIDFIRKAANKGYVIHKRDDDAEVNITLLEYLKQIHQIDISGLNPPPQDESGVDVRKIFAVLRHAVMDRNGWDVIDTSFVANFSFSQFVMWNDIHSHSDLLANNKIVRSLIKGTVDWDVSIPVDMDDDTFLPVPVDASQLRAIKMAANGVSFVLHGPPGTGKSQTITAMISNALSKGKTVLFVAEKRAALEVVQKRLAQLGIENFCLELHSNKAVKRTILDQLSHSLENRVLETPTDYASKIDKVHQMRAELDKYVSNLHSKHTSGMSVRELIDAYEAIPDFDQSYRVRSSDVSKMTASDFENASLLITKLTTYGSSVNSLGGSPLSFVKQTEYKQSMRKQLEDMIFDLPKLIDSVESEAGKFASLIGDSKPVRKDDWHYFTDFAKAFSEGAISNAELANNPFYKRHEAYFKYEEYAHAFTAAHEEFAKKYNESILTADLEDISKRYAEAQKRFLGKAKAVNSVKNELQSHVKVPTTPEQITVLMTEISSYKEIKSNYDDIKASSGIGSLGVITNIKNTASVFLKAYSDFSEKDSELMDMLRPEIDDSENWLESKREIIRIIDSNESELRDWMNYQAIRKECVDNGLESLCKVYEGGFPSGQLGSLYFKAVYKALIWDYIEENNDLNAFNGGIFNEKIRQYKDAEEELLKLTREEMYYRLTHNLPSTSEGGETAKEITFLKRAISSNGRGLSIRALFERIPHILTRLCPCLLMSPMSVAQYLPIDTDLFDIVVFDEASQVPTSQAVGSLARGKDGIIVGDPRQLPPTSFFSTNLFDEENLDLEDLDSILDDCLALGMPETHLRWHYRSRHESLIAFSNKEYYDEKMFTFPSVNDRERHVKLCTVNGTYCRKKGSKNYKEGEAIVSEILRRYHNEELRKQSIGVVTFNIRQQELIEDLLDEEYKKDPDFDVWAHKLPEELFVKNLENVQGDERDVILFSIGYGPDENGKIYYNFGPLNKDGGWRRLNVAVSRSRLEMIVFSSMTPDMINTNRTNAKGVLGLKDFLFYAQNGILGNKLFDDDIRKRGITLKLCSAIEEAGYKTQKDVGSSNIKIDIAVINPFDEDEYLLGIIFDGDSYRVASTTKDRELSQVSVLEGLGWRLHRVWTMDWWDNSKKEIGTVLDILSKEKALAEERSLNPEFKDKGPVSEEIVYSQSEESTKTTKKKKDEGEVVSDFETYERFRSLTPKYNEEDKKEE